MEQERFGPQYAEGLPELCCTATYHASLRKHDSQTVRWERFLEHLDGKELTPQAPAQDAPGMGMEPTMC